MDCCSCFLCCFSYFHLQLLFILVGVPCFFIVFLLSLSFLSFLASLSFSLDLMRPCYFAAGLSCSFPIAYSKWGWLLGEVSIQTGRCFCSCGRRAAHQWSVINYGQRVRYYILVLLDIIFFITTKMDSYNKYEISSYHQSHYNSLSLSLNCILIFPTLMAIHY